MPAPFRDCPADCFRSQLFPSGVFDLSPDDRGCFVCRDLLEQLDASEVDAQYSRRGRHAHAPRQVVSIPVCAHSRGAFGSRRTGKRCNGDLGFMHIAGKRRPNFRALSDFRKDRGDFFRSRFRRTVQMAPELDMASLGHVSLDGSKFKANGSKHEAMGCGRVKERERRLCGEVEVLAERARRCGEEEGRACRERTGHELREGLRDGQQRPERIRQARRALEAREAELRPGRAIEGNKQVSFADEDARIMGGKGAFDYAHNARVGVDGDARIIVGQHVSRAANDRREVGRALDEPEASSGRLPDRMGLDNGCCSGDNLRAASDRGVEARIAADRGGKPAKTGLEDSGRPLVKADFRYGEARDGFHCPGGQFPALRRVDAEGLRAHRGEDGVCAARVCHDRCCRPQSGAARAVAGEGREPLRRAMNDRMSRPESRAVRRRRKAIVEPVFGQIRNAGFRGSGARGPSKVAGEFPLVCAARNVRKMVRAAAAGVVRLEFGQRAALARIRAGGGSEHDETA